MKSLYTLLVASVFSLMVVDANAQAAQAPAATGLDAYFRFTVMSYDITITMSKKDDDNATGTLMDMFEVVGVRVKEEEKKTQQ